MFSIVQTCDGEHVTKCGYCKKKDTSMSYGMWAHRLTPEDYQALIDRGWRRSGKYCYKPSMTKTCCPTYTIRCNANTFVLRRSHKKVLKRMLKYVAGTLEGEIRRRRNSSTSSDHRRELSGVWAAKRAKAEHREPQTAPTPMDIGRVAAAPLPSPVPVPQLTPAAAQSLVPQRRRSSSSSGNGGAKAASRGGDAAQPRTPPAQQAYEYPRKAKVIRLERKIAKLRAQGRDVEEALAESREKWRRNSRPVSIEKLMEVNPRTRTHRLEVTCVPAAVTDEVFALYHKYQIAVHGDKPEKVTKESFKRFLVDSPLTRVPFPAGLKVEGVDGYGTYHQLYRVDKRLVAVGVLDILPKCVSSVYLFYDPEFAMLSLGVYSSLRELYLARRLSQHLPELKYQYLGYYIHTCPKMRYKAQFGPAELLCPHSFEFEPFDRCIARHDLSVGTSLREGAPNDVPDVDPADTLLAIEGRPMAFKTLPSTIAVEIHQTVREYSKRVGSQLSARMVLCLS